MPRSLKAVCFFLAVGLIAIGVSASAVELTPKEQLGKQLFFDTSLSLPSGTSCASCHDPAAGFADPRTDLPTSPGAVPCRYGNRNSPSAAYLIAGPEQLELYNGGYAGGLFWDGRANGLAEQALGPFLNPLEMMNANERTVVVAVRKADYAPLFRSLYGARIFADVEQAFLAVGDAIAAYERSAEVNPFTAKIDYYLRGEAELSPMERMGMMVFHGRGGCSACHSQGRAAGQACPGGCSCGCAYTGVCKCEDCTCGCPTRGEEACAGGCRCGCAGTGVCTCGPGCTCGCPQTTANACAGGCTCGCAFTRFCTCGPGCQCGCPQEPPVCEGGCACGCSWTCVCTCGPGCDCGCPSGGMADGHPLLTNHNFFNLGVPANSANPYYGLPPALNRDGADWIDYGLGAMLAGRGVGGAHLEMGKFKVPTLRNVTLTSPYMHNGVFKELRTVVEFYNTRDVPGAGWGPPEVAANVFTDMSYGNIGLTEEDIDALIAFLGTLTDGYVPAGAKSRPVLAAAKSAGTSIGAVYPNPFNATTRIAFTLASPGRVRLAVYDVAGRLVRTLVDGSLQAGPVSVTWDGRDARGSAVASGNYYGRLVAGRHQETMRMVLVK